MNWTTLKNEIVNDPLGRGYVGMTDAAVAASLNTVNRARSRGVIPAYEVVDAIVSPEWSALTTGEQRRIELIISAGQVNVLNVNVRAAFLAAFGAGTTTRTNLAALQTENISRVTELGLPTAHAGDVAYAKIFV